MIIAEPGAPTATAVLQLGGPPALAEWLYRDGLDGAAALRECPRADWLVWLGAVDGAGDSQLLAAGVAAVRTALPLVADEAWPLAAALDAVDGQPCTHVPTAHDLALEIVQRDGVGQRVALAVRAVRRAMVSHRTLAVRILASAVTAAAIAATEVRHTELAALSVREVAQRVDGAWRARADRGLQGATLSLGVVAVMRQLRLLVPVVRPLVERFDLSTGAG